MRAECYLIFVEFGDQKRMAALSELKALIFKIMPNCNLHVVIVDNSTANDIEICLDPRTNVISGNNTSRDFSGYDRGLEWIRNRRKLNNNTVVVFANDTIHESVNLPFFQRLNEQLFKLFMKMDGTVGYVDCFPVKVKLGRLKFKSWIKSNLIFIKYSNLRNIDKISLPFTDDKIFSDNWNEFFAKNSVANKDYQKLLKGWLFGEKVRGINFKERWHSAKPLTRRNFSLFKVKTRAILSEHFLSARLIEMKSPVIDVKNLNY